MVLTLLDKAHLETSVAGEGLVTLVTLVGPLLGVSPLMYADLTVLSKPCITPTTLVRLVSCNMQQLGLAEGQTDYKIGHKQLID